MISYSLEHRLPSKLTRHIGWEGAKWCSFSLYRPVVESCGNGNEHLLSMKREEFLD